jgi:hypothetical protein
LEIQAYEVQDYHTAGRQTVLLEVNALENFKPFHWKGF